MQLHSAYVTTTGRLHCDAIFIDLETLRGQNSKFVQLSTRRFSDELVSRSH